MTKYSLKAQLADFMLSKGIDSWTAKKAAEKCSDAIVKNSVVGSLSFASALVFLTRQPLTAIGAVPAGAFFASAGTLIASASCDDVRAAASRWSQFPG